MLTPCLMQGCVQGSMELQVFHLATLEGIGELHNYLGIYIHVTILARTPIDLLYKDTLHSRFNIQSSLHNSHPTYVYSYVCRYVYVVI